jgi:hypothetical protein
MAQDPWLVDQIQIEPGSTGTRTINRNAADNSLLFTDPVAGALTLSQLSGIKSGTQVFVVGKGGAGVEYTTVQSAVDAVNGATTSAAAPAVIFILPGVYQEDVSITKDGIHFIGIGWPTIESAHEDTPDVNASNTVTIQSAGTYAPKQCILQNLIITNSHAPAGDTGACVRITQGSGVSATSVGLVDTAAGVLYGTGGIRIIDCMLRARGAGGYQIRADAINHLYVQGGSWKWSHATSTVLVEEVAEFRLTGVGSVNNLQMDYDNTAVTKPITVGSSYTLEECGTIGDISSALSGAGSLTINGCPNCGHYALSGDRTGTLRFSTVQNMIIGVGTEVTMVSSTRTGTAAGGGKVNESVYRSTLAFAGDITLAVTLPWERLDATYTVVLDMDSLPIGSSAPAIAGKLATGFSVTFNAAQTMAVSYIVEQGD